MTFWARARSLFGRSAAPDDTAGQVDTAFREALTLHQQGRYQEAEQSYLKVLALAPDHAPALNFLGTLAYQIGTRNANTVLRLKDEEDERVPLSATDFYKSRDRDAGAFRTLEYDEGRDKPVFQQMQGVDASPGMVWGGSTPPHLRAMAEALR